VTLVERALPERERQQDYADRFGVYLEVYPALKPCIG
jgi:xylulokinase